MELGLRPIHEAPNPFSSSPEGPSSHIGNNSGSNITSQNYSKSPSGRPLSSMRFHVIDLLFRLFRLRLGLAFSPTSAPITVVADFSNVTESYENSACAPQPPSDKPGKEKQRGEFSGAEVPSAKIFDQQQAGGPLLEIALRIISPLWLGLTQSNVHEGKVPRRHLEQKQNFPSPLQFSMKIRQPLPLKHWCPSGEIEMPTRIL